MTSSSSNDGARIHGAENAGNTAMAISDDPAATTSLVPLMVREAMLVPAHSIAMGSDGTGAVAPYGPLRRARPVDDDTDSIRRELAETLAREETWENNVQRQVELFRQHEQQQTRLALHMMQRAGREAIEFENEGAHAAV